MPIENNGAAKFKAGQFQGRVEEALKNISNDIVDMKVELQSIRKKVDGNRLKIAGIGATVSLIVTILTLLIKELMAG